MITLSDNTPVQMYGTVFTSVSTDITNRTNKEMSEENIFNNDVKDTSNITYQASKELQNSSLVAFNDPTNGKFAIVSLKKETIDMLKSHFGEEDFYKRDDGILRLDNKAESYVAGWFADIAYKREFLSADSNKDGQLSSSEYKNTRNEFAGHGMIDSNGVNEYVDASYQKVGDNDSLIVLYNKQGDKIPVSLDDELNKTLLINDDFNDNISLRESFNTIESNKVLTTKKIVEKHLTMAGITQDEIDQILRLMEAEDKRRKAEDDKEEKNLLVKVLENKGDTTILNEVELKIFERLNISTVEDISKNLEKREKLEKYKEYE